ncbi:MAG: adenylate/guanylate cyclase domain-containing protein [Cyanobacteriota bacterium]|nr:adenylate/guanylate cyclase domain-containing protein [Cyanobacteriota bacterium]
MNKAAIVCVDDEQMILESLKIQLRQAFSSKYPIETAESGEEALELIEELLEEEYEIAAIISDYIMPHMKGDELLAKVHEISPSTLKIMLTGQADIDAVANAVQYAQLYRYITKPWESEDLILTVTEAIHSYFQEKEIEAQNKKLVVINADLKALNQEQVKLIAKLKEQDKHLSQLNQAYERFVPNQFLQLLKKESIIQVELGDQIEAEMSVLFAKIHNFADISTDLSPEKNFKFINAYLSRMEPAIVENSGFIDKYMGDVIMAIFSQSADHAVQAGVTILKQLDEYNQHRRKSNYIPLEIGIGINTGKLMLGTVGGKSRMDGTVISDAVNLASRIEGLTPQYGAPLLISNQTFSRLDGHRHFEIRALDRVRVKGKSQHVSVFEVFDADPPSLRQSKSAMRSTFERGLVFFSLKQFEKAIRQFKECLHQNADDRVAKIYLARCKKKLQSSG